MKIAASQNRFRASALRVNPQNANTKVDDQAFLDSYVSQIQEAKGDTELPSLRQTNVPLAFEVATNLLGPVQAVALAGEAMLSLADSEDKANLDAGTLARANAEWAGDIRGTNADLYFGDREKTGFGISTTKNVVLPKEFKNLARQPVGSFLMGHEMKHIEQGDVLKQFGHRYLLAQLEGTPFAAEAAEAKKEVDHEIELAADERGVEFMLERGHKPEVIRSNVQQILGFTEADPSDSHPGRDTRMNRIEEVLASGRTPKSVTPSLLGEAKLAEKREQSPTIAVVDFFGDKSLHGEFVESLITEVGFEDSDIQRYSGEMDTPVGLLTGKAEGFEDRLNSFISETPSRVLDQASANLTDILKQGQAKVVNMSLGDSKIDTVERIVNRSKHNKSFGRMLWKHLGVGSYGKEKDQIQALAMRVDEISDKSDRLKEAKGRFEILVNTAAEQGVHVVLAAGNRGQLASAYKNAGIPVKEDFFASHLAVDKALIVAASTSSGDRAGLTPPNAGADLAAPGSIVTSKLNGRIMMKSGTSFAAPQVSRELARMVKENPQESFEQRESRLMKQLTPVPGEENYLGAGSLLKKDS